MEVWGVLRQALKDRQDGEGFESEQLNALFNACRDHLLSITDILVSTNGNAKCGEILAWADVDKENKPKFMALLMDEVAKEQEINVWNVITAVLPRTPDLCVFFGDERQLDPVNTCSRNGLEFNPFNARLDISLFTRLIREGFPHVHLTMQQRMHPVLSKFPNAESYEGALEDAEGVQRNLEVVKPGLSKVLHGIIAKSFSDPVAQQRYIDNATDEEARLHYLEMPGCKESFEDRSRKIQDQIDIFFEVVFPSLQDYFGSSMEEDVMLIIGYGLAIGEYEHRIHRLKVEQKLPKSHYPRCYTIDSSQGQEAAMTIVDGSIRYREHLGFMTDRGRCNVAMTRAKEVFWILGGSLDRKDGLALKSPLSPFPKLKDQLETTGQVHCFYKR